VTFANSNNSLFLKDIAIPRNGWNEFYKNLDKRCSKVYF